MLVCELCRLHRAWGHECAIASFAPSQPEFLKEAAELERLGVALYFPERAKAKLGRTLYYRDAIKSFQPDFVFGQASIPSLYGRFATGWGSKRLSYASVMHSSDDFARLSFALAERLTRFRINHVISVSEQGASNYIRRFGQHIPVSIIKNGIDIGRFAYIDRKTAREKLRLNSHVRLALQVGRICDTKQQLLSLSALRPLLEACQVLLWFAGLTEDHAYEARLRKIITEWGLEHAVRFLGSRDDIPDLLAAADLYLMPSRNEAQSVAILEALASSIPIIASDIPAFNFAREMPSVRICGVEDESAWMNAARDMLAEPRATRNISVFNIEQTAQAYLDVAQKLS